MTTIKALTAAVALGVSLIGSAAHAQFDGEPRGYITTGKEWAQKEQKATGTPHADWLPYADWLARTCRPGTGCNAFIAEQERLAERDRPLWRVIVNDACVHPSSVGLPTTPTDLVESIGRAHVLAYFNMSDPGPMRIANYTYVAWIENGRRNSVSYFNDPPHCSMALRRITSRSGQVGLQ